MDVARATRRGARGPRSIRSTVRASLPKSWRRCGSCSANTRAGPVGISTIAAGPASTVPHRAGPIVATSARAAATATRARLDSSGRVAMAAPPDEAVRAPTGAARVPIVVAHAPIGVVRAPIVEPRDRIRVRALPTEHGETADSGPIETEIEGRVLAVTAPIAPGVPTADIAPDPPARALDLRSRFRFWNNRPSSGSERFSTPIR